jgi:sugar phosphate isomerase/epimerase
MKLRLGCSSICFRSQPFDSALDAIARLGFDEMDVGAVPGFCEHYLATDSNAATRQAFVAQVQAAGVRVRTINADPGCFHAPGADPSSIRHAFHEYVLLARQLGAVGVSVGTGIPVERAAVGSALARTARGLSDLAAVAADEGLQLLVEAPHTMQLCTTVDLACELADQVAGENVRLTLDSSHVHVSGASLPATARSFGSRLAHVHLRDARGRDFHYAIGEGDIEFAAFFEALQNMGYEGHFTLELETRTPAGVKKLQEVASSRDRVIELWEAASLAREQAAAAN